MKTIELKELKDKVKEISLSNEDIGKYGDGFEKAIDLINKGIEALTIHVVSESFPSIYEKQYNATRIKYYKTMAKNYNITESSVMHIFNDACDWYSRIIEKHFSNSR